MLQIESFLPFTAAIANAEAGALGGTPGSGSIANAAALSGAAGANANAGALDLKNGDSASANAGALAGAEGAGNVSLRQYCFLK